jgi:hypothetical protein
MPQRLDDETVAGDFSGVLTCRQQHHQRRVITRAQLNRTSSFERASISSLSSSAGIFLLTTFCQDAALSGSDPAGKCEV